jgi:hypothetical protein
MSGPEIEKAIGVAPIETIAINPGRPLYTACLRMLETRARRIPLIDIDDETKRAMVVCVITQYRILKFMAINVTETQLLRKPLRELNLGTYTNLQTASMDTPVLEVIKALVRCSISSVPILNSDGMRPMHLIYVGRRVEKATDPRRCAGQCFRSRRRNHPDQGWQLRRSRPDRWRSSPETIRGNLPPPPS